MEPFRPSFNTIITQQQAKARAPNGLCSDQTHIKRCPIEKCPAEKLLVLYKDNASYTIIHAGVAEYAIPGPKKDAPLVHPPCDGSRKMLRECVAVEKAESSKMRVQNMLEMTQASKKLAGVAPPATFLPMANSASVKPTTSTTEAPVIDATAKIPATVSVGNGVPKSSSDAKGTVITTPNAHSSAAGSTKAAAALKKTPASPNCTTRNEVANISKAARPLTDAVGTVANNAKAALAPAPSAADKKKNVSKLINDDEDWELVHAPKEEFVTLTNFRAGLVHNDAAKKPADEAENAASKLVSMVEGVAQKPDYGVRTATKRYATVDEWVIIEGNEEVEAESYAIYGLCGDRSQTRNTPTTSCKEDKLLVINMADASYSVAHSIADWERTGPMRSAHLVHQRTKASENLLRVHYEFEAALKEKRAAGLSELEAIDAALSLSQTALPNEEG
ncbi:hypothetical protein B0A55_01987 [Friedmanniomyces simplex]|uniref:Uncharacterized protein n=1 Tax=Friedmanniomyces simplex TaxID=329884 RepID=A0A4U0XMH7_9PEZI|nr:hypothetical protein B0A55_01987 [Friedmanniomyces simplex]